MLVSVQEDGAVYASRKPVLITLFEWIEVRHPTTRSLLKAVELSKNLIDSYTDRTYEIENVYCCNLYVVRGLGLSGGYYVHCVGVVIR